MLQIRISLTEGFDEKTRKFVISSGFDIDLEHSLVSLSKWESKWEIPFLGPEKKTEEQTLDYIRMMILGEIPPEEVLFRLSASNFIEIDRYINSKMTATWFNDRNLPRPGSEIVTAEIIYYWMISLGVPFECQYWHLSRLLTLIKVCSIKNAPKKKMSRKEILDRQRELNVQRRRATGSSG